MKNSPIDLVLGHPRVALSASRLLTGDVTTPYGNLPNDDVVLAAWRLEAGDRPPPPWLILGRRDAPSGTIWKLAWCPPIGKLPEGCEIVLPEAAWALERLNDIQGPEGWHLRSLESPSGFWVGLWEGTRCEHLQTPGRERQAALDLERTVARHHQAENPQEFLADWSSPNTRGLELLAESAPESDLLDWSESTRRLDRRATATAIARTLAVGLLLGLVTAGFGLFQGVQAYQRDQQESRLESVKDLVDHSANLETSNNRMRDSLRTFRDALRRSQAADLIVAGIAAKIPASARLQAMALEETPNGWRVRTEAHLPDWDAIQPLTQALRKVPRVTKVTVANQARQADAISATLEIEGVWP